MVRRNPVIIYYTFHPSICGTAQHRNEREAVKAAFPLDTLIDRGNLLDLVATDQSLRIADVVIFSIYRGYADKRTHDEILLAQSSGKAIFLFRGKTLELWNETFRVVYPKNESGHYAIPVPVAQLQSR